MTENGQAAQPPAAAAAGAAATPVTLTPTLPGSKLAIPVVLSEAKLDSPSFRATAHHFADQVDAIEKWLDGYAKTTAKLCHDMLGLEETINSYLSKILPPPVITSLDHDYTALALKRLGDGTREWWTSVVGMARTMDTLSVEPVRNFQHGDLRSFRETKRTLELAQKAFDTALGRYVGQSKTKEPSSLREDAFAVFETRKAYLKASMDFCQLAPQLRLTLDKLLIRVSSDIWREVKRSRDTIGNNFAKYGHEMDRVKGWTKEMELAEPAFKRELQAVRRELEENALASFAPSRELDHYSASTVPFLGSRGPMSVTPHAKSSGKSEMQGWLYMRTIAGKPARHTWIRRWYYCRDGKFGWLINVPQGVLQGDEIGILLCNAKPAVAEERRFCFEIKTKIQTLLLQAESQAELMEWLEVFEVAKKRAFEASIGREASTLPGGVDPAFAVTPPSLPEFSAKALDAQVSADDSNADRSGNLPVPGTEGGLIPRASFDINPAAPPKRSATSALVREEGESSREHAARIMQKLDLHRKAFASNSDSTAAPPSPMPPAGGIASLISASHGLLPGYPPPVVGQISTAKGLAASLGPESQPGSLGPATLAKPPAATSLSRTAVAYSSERVLNAIAPNMMPTAILANYWGSNAWTQESMPKTNRVDLNPDDPFGPNSPTITMTAARDGNELKSPTSIHKKSVSMDTTVVNQAQDRPLQETFPSNYPVELKTNSAQFRLLFPGVPLDEKLVLVFRASWTSTAEGKPDTQKLEGNGRVYVTSEGNMYFYGHQLGLVVTYAFSLDRITEVTAAPGKDCDFIFLHLAQDEHNPFSRITIKTFLENLDLLHARLNLLIDDLQAEEPMDIQELIRTFIEIEKDILAMKRRPSVESWEDLSASELPEDGTASRTVSPRPHEFTFPSRTRTTRRRRSKVRLPTHPVLYEPDDMQLKVAERHFEISAKACFHVLFGDKSFVFPKLYFDRRAQQITQGPWTTVDGRMQRVFQFNVDYKQRFIGQSKNEGVTDYQTIELFEDHVTYVVSHVKTLWHLPHADTFKLVTKVVITHVGKSKCKLALFSKIVWDNAPTIGKRIIEREARQDAEHDGEELAEIATDQVRKLGAHSRTKRAIQIYGAVGQQTQALTFTPGDAAKADAATRARRPRINPRTLGAMILDTIRSFAESVASTLVMFALAGVRRLWSALSAQRLLLALLAFSVVTNLTLSSQGAAAWWADRRAASFMRRVGVGPNPTMSKAIYLVDLDEAARGSASALLSPSSGAANEEEANYARLRDESYCYATFQTIANATDMDAVQYHHHHQHHPQHHADDGSGSGDSGSGWLASPESRAAARRLRRTRQRLGGYRHDLLVAMRLVNSVERELLRSEWENWLLDENLRCDQVAEALALAGRRGSDSDNATTASSASVTPSAAGAGGGDGGQKVLGGEEGGDGGADADAGGKEGRERKRENLRAWYHEYCGSCREDRDVVLRSRERWSLV